ncbi:carboxypeptidase-like regulatory domain-containing protein [Marinimicrobium sp. LS-A18]|uniref:DUF6795 domain-containing protein n=1 Tax=Marinimicrobium sp. LS-A18 TaxID=1381596 RepID=UPI000462F5CF|nr:carboxypeptidase-like regulatory domain-containing protein [Marinimicrobium sp. LS-A18]
MSLFDIGKVCVFSKVNAQLLLDGKPISGVTVTRTWNWDKRASDSTVTDMNGYFSFPAVHQRSVKPLLPLEITITQQLSTTHNGKEYILWRGAKRDSEEQSELDGAPFNLTCELTNEERLIDTYRSPILTLCHIKEDLP